MKRSYLIIGGIVGFLLVMFFMYRGTYNTAVELQESVDEKWSNVQSAYQRRADMIPNLVKVVKGAAENEKEILTKVTQARAGIVGDIQNAKNPEQLEMAGRKINTAINLAFEAYPQIRSTENFQKLQDQLEGTENRINRERDLYNESIKEYNSHIRGFFNSMVLSRSEFPKKEGFKSKSGAENAPEVNL